MKQQLSDLLENLAHVHVVIRPRNPDHSISLLDQQLPFEIEFNGYWSVYDYRAALHQSCTLIRNSTAELFRNHTVSPSEACFELHWHWMQIHDFRGQFLPRRKKKKVFSRISFEYDGIDKSSVDAALLKSEIRQFFSAQTRLLKTLEKHFKLTIKIMNQIYQWKHKQFHRDIRLKGADVKSTDPVIELQWNGTKTDLVELYNTLYKVKFISGRDGKPLQKKDLFSAVTKLYNFPIKNVNTLLHASQNRKMEKSALFALLSEASSD